MTETEEVAVALQQARELLPAATDGQRLRRLVALGGDKLAEQARFELSERRRRAQMVLINSGTPQDEQTLVLAEALDSPYAT